MFRFGFKKIEASQYFGTLGAPEPGEASTFLGFKCKNAGRPQKTLMTQSFGSLGRPALNTKKLRPLSILKLWGLPNLERPNLFEVQDSQRLKPLNTWGLWEGSKTLRGLNLVEVQDSKRLGLSVFCSSHSPKVLRGLNLSDLGYSLPRPPTD